VAVVLQGLVGQPKRRGRAGQVQQQDVGQYDEQYVNDGAMLAVAAGAGLAFTAGPKSVLG
jgi:hypothetical protein